MNIFNIDYHILIQLVLPIRKRKPLRRAWLFALISPVVYMYNLFLFRRTDRLYQLSHNAQVVYMQSLLNDRFDANLRRIFISDTPNISPLFTYTVPEQKYVYLYTTAENNNQTFFTHTEIAIANNGFIVNIPTTLNIDHATLTALVDAFRLPSKNNYSIQTF